MLLLCVLAPRCNCCCLTSSTTAVLLLGVLLVVVLAPPAGLLSTVMSMNTWGRVGSGSGRGVSTSLLPGSACTRCRWGCTPAQAHQQQQSHRPRNGFQLRWCVLLPATRCCPQVCWGCKVRTAADPQHPDAHPLLCPSEGGVCWLQHMCVQQHGSPCLCCSRAGLLPLVRTAPLMHAGWAMCILRVSSFTAAAQPHLSAGTPPCPSSAPWRCRWPACARCAN